MRFACPKCQQRYEIDNQPVGKYEIECSHCQNKFTLTVNPSKTKEIRWYHALLMILGIWLAIFFLVWGNATQYVLEAAIGIFISLCIAFVPLASSAREKSFIICPNPNCGYRGDVEPQGGTNGCLLAVLLLLGILPGILYILICGGMNKIICPKCGMKIR